MPRFHVQKSTLIQADPQRVFDVVSDFDTWTTWSPWLCSEPNAKVTVSADSDSVGSLYAWEGELVGAGEIEHRRLESGRLIEDEIRFSKPFKSTSQVKFELSARDGHTELTWHMEGSLPFFLFWMKGMMQTMIGMDYDRGLRMVKDLIETGEVASQTRTKGIESVGPLRVIGIRKTCTIGDVGKSMEEAFCSAREIMSSAGLPADSDVVSVYHNCDFKQQTFDYTAGFAIASSDVACPAGMSEWSIPNMQALAIEHIGKYQHLGNAWSAGHQHLRYKKMKPAKCGGYEIYRNDPATTKAAQLKTDVYLPLKLQSSG